MKQLLLVAIFIIAGILQSCSSTTLISSNDKDVKIYVDGMYVGKGSFTYSDTKIVGSSTSVMFKKDGCEDFTTIFTRSEEFDAGACAGGVFTLVPFLWIEKYRPVHNYEFECIKKK